MPCFISSNRTAPGRTFGAPAIVRGQNLNSRLNVAAKMAMEMGKHVYCQKPLTQTVHEARELVRIAKEKKLATQMGNQGSAGNGLRRAVEVIQSGVIGNPLELHVWSNRPVWPQGIERPKGESPIPQELDWNLWLGPAATRPYVEKAYHTFNWRGFMDFGTGALGDMACHTVNMPFRALKLGYPDLVKDIPESIPRSPGHYKEWIEMIKGGLAAYSNFEIAGYLTEIILLGCIALRVGEGVKMEWDGPNMRSPNCPQAARFVQRNNRTGW